MFSENRFSSDFCLNPPSSGVSRLPHFLSHPKGTSSYLCGLKCPDGSFLPLPLRRGTPLLEHTLPGTQAESTAPSSPTPPGTHLSGGAHRLALDFTQSPVRHPQPWYTCEAASTRSLRARGMLPAVPSRVAWTDRGRGGGGRVSRPPVLLWLGEHRGPEPTVEAAGERGPSFLGVLPE